MTKRLVFFSKIINQEFGKFIMVGVLNTVINYGVFILLFIAFNLIYFVAGAIGFLSGSVSGFFLNRLWPLRASFQLQKVLLSTSLYSCFVWGHTLQHK